MTTEGLVWLAKKAGLVLAYWLCFAAAVAAWLGLKALAAWAWAKRKILRSRRAAGEAAPRERLGNVGAVEARKGEEMARMRRLERRQEMVLMVLSLAPGVIVFAGFAWGALKWVMGWD